MIAVKNRVLAPVFLLYRKVMRKFTIKNGKKMRFGYTTGSCAAAAAAAAAQMLLTGQKTEAAAIKLPAGEEIVLPVEDVRMEMQQVSCAVTKDGGDDPDATHGAKIFATVRFGGEKGEIRISGGEGVGVVTARGLQCPVGDAAINPVPRQMIRENCLRVLQSCGEECGLDIEISVPGGKEIAERTFNPRLGIKGGISILGTTGIVEPMSEKALIDTIKAVVDKQQAEDPEFILISPGNYGRDFCREYLGLDIEKAVPVSNYIGEALDYIRYKGFRKILLVGHTGKLIKIAAGVMNTHSSYADCRMEIIALYSLLAGADRKTAEAILQCVNTDEALDMIAEQPWYGQVKERILEKVLYHLQFRLRDSSIQIETVMFTTDRRHIFKSSQADDLIRHFRLQEEEYEG